MRVISVLRKGKALGRAAIGAVAARVIAASNPSLSAAKPSETSVLARVTPGPISTMKHAYMTARRAQTNMAQPARIP